MSDFKEMLDDLIHYQEVSAASHSVEATAHMRHYAKGGYWRLEAIGFGQSREEAGAAAKLLLGQASAAIRVAVDVPRRVQEITESASE